MGIKGLTKFLKSQASSSIRQVGIKEYEGQTLGVDISGFIHSTSYRKEIKGKGNHLREMFEIIVACTLHNIRLIIVFDGNSIDAKKETLTVRKDIKDKQIQQILSLTNGISGSSPRDHHNKSLAEIKETAIQAIRENPTSSSEDREKLEKYLKNCISIDPNMYGELIHLLKLCNVHYVRAMYEADHMLARLSKDGIIQGVLSEDLDMLTHGCKKLIRGIHSREFKTEGILTQYCLDDVLCETGLNMSQFVDFCILCKCDYTSTIKNLGPNTAHKLLRDGNTIEDIVLDINNGKYKKYAIEDNFDYVTARLGFTYCDLENPCEIYQQYNNKNISEIRTYLLSSTNYTPHTLQKKLDILKTEIPNPDVDVSQRKTKILPLKPKVTDVIPKKTTIIIKHKLTTAL